MNAKTLFVRNAIYGQGVIFNALVFFHGTPILTMAFVIQIAKVDDTTVPIEIELGNVGNFFVSGFVLNMKANVVITWLQHIFGNGGDVFTHLVFFLGNNRLVCNGGDNPIAGGFAIHF